jgi:hypothetical protein
MIYIISGASRAGKTIIAKKISAKKNISYFSIDWLVMGFTNGIPEYGIHHMLFPHDIAKRSWSFLKAMIESILVSDMDYILEGEAILPELIIELLNQYPDKIRICFLGFTNVNLVEKVNDIKDFSRKEKDWLSDKSEAYILDHVQNMIVHSIQIKKSCAENNLTYMDTSKNFINTIDKAIAYLVR